jgi:TRAP-type mannitol/chloroaromatic compound transport system substrate-binding protein
MTMMLASYDAKNPAALRRLIAGGAEIRAFPRDVMDACFKASLETFDDLSNKNPDFKTIYEPWTKFANESNAWFRLAEYRLDSARFTAPSR